MRCCCTKMVATSPHKKYLLETISIKIQWFRNQEVCTDFSFILSYSIQSGRSSEIYRARWPNCAVSWRHTGHICWDTSVTYPADWLKYYRLDQKISDFNWPPNDLQWLVKPSSVPVWRYDRCPFMCWCTAWFFCWNWSPQLLHPLRVWSLLIRGE